MTYGNVLDSCLGPSFIFHGLQVRIDPYKEIWWILCCSVSKLFSPHPPSSRPKPRTYVFIFSGPAATRWDEFESLRFDVCLSCSRGVPRQSYSSSCCSPLVMFFPFFFPFSLSLPLRMMLLLSSVFCFPWKRIAFSLCFPFSELSYTKQKTNLTLHPTTDIKFMSSIRLGGKWKLWENILLQQQGTQPYFFYWFKKKKHNYCNYFMNKIIINFGGWNFSTFSGEGSIY